MARPLIAIYGATGTGKTDLASRVADDLPVHLVSCDAVQVYRGLDAATAKPIGDERRHSWALVDCVDPGVDADLGWWARAAEREIARAASADRIPLVVGGTGMYLRGLLKGVGPAPPRHPATRARLEALAERHGAGMLHRVLGRLDPEGAESLTPGDRQRLIRALEVRLLTGQPLRALHSWGWRGPDRWPTFRIALALPRPLLYERTDARVRRFFEQGLVAEVRALLAAGVPVASNAFKAIGYREVVSALAAGEADEGSLVEQVQRATRRYVKRQETWFRSEPAALLLDSRDPERAWKAVSGIRAFLAARGD